MYRKRYNLETLKQTINDIIEEEGKFYLTLGQLLNEIGYDLLDVNEFYIKNVKHVMRYNKR